MVRLVLISTTRKSFWDQRIPSYREELGKASASRSRLANQRCSRLLGEAAAGSVPSPTDKTWGLTDCMSMVIMQEQELFIAATADEHFVQAGYRALLLESE